MKQVIVIFVSEDLQSCFNSLDRGKYEDKILKKTIDNAIDALKSDPCSGIKIARKKWPERYIKEYRVINLWKLNLSKAWRMTYMIKENDTHRFCIILEWMNHKEYERKFQY